MATSPLIRRLLHERGISPSSIRGTGPGGRITREDVEGHSGSSSSSRGAERPVVSIRPTQDEVIPFGATRKLIADHMVRSKATSPHVLQFTEVDFERVARVRDAHRNAFEATERFPLTYLPFIARAACDALSEYPRLNASMDADALIVHSSVNLGIIVDVHFEGFVVPVIQAAETKSLRALARDIHDVAERARTKQLTPDEVVGGTFTISATGSFGVSLTAPIINQPQVAIMSADQVTKKPVVIESADGDAIVVHRVGFQGVCFDHRANDGAYSASFLQRYKEIIETRDWEAELA